VFSLNCLNFFCSPTFGKGKFIVNACEWHTCDTEVNGKTKKPIEQNSSLEKNDCGEAGDGMVSEDANSPGKYYFTPHAYSSVALSAALLHPLKVDPKMKPKQVLMVLSQYVKEQPTNSFACKVRKYATNTLQSESIQKPTTATTVNKRKALYDLIVSAWNKRGLKFDYICINYHAQCHLSDHDMMEAALMRGEVGWWPKSWPPSSSLMAHPSVGESSTIVMQGGTDFYESGMTPCEVVDEGGAKAYGMEDAMRTYASIHSPFDIMEDRAASPASSFDSSSSSSSSSTTSSSSSSHHDEFIGTMASNV
jgi:hypothetical protein